MFQLVFVLLALIGAWPSTTGAFRAARVSKRFPLLHPIEFSPLA